MSAPPAGPPWDLPLDVAPLAFVDLEMTGLDPNVHRVVEICVQRVVGGEVVAELTSLVAPEPSIQIDNVKVHGITRDALAGAPSFASLAPRIAQLLEGAVLVAHAARHDVGFLRAGLGRAGVAWDATHFVDTLALSRRTSSSPSHRLAALADSLGLPNPRPHRADNDVLLTRGVLAHMLEKLQPDTPRALWALCSGHGVQPGVMAAAQRALELQCVARVRYRPSSRGPQELLFVATAIRTDLDPPVVLGYLQPTRGRRELRADRILTFELQHESAS
jgi:DNA polymerase-3 subunit epsilon